MSLYPHRKYARRPFERRHYFWRHNHDGWKFAYIALLLLLFLALEAARRGA